MKLYCEEIYTEKDGSERLLQKDLRNNIKKFMTTDSGMHIAFVLSPGVGNEYTLNNSDHKLIELVYNQFNLAEEDSNDASEDITRKIDRIVAWN